MIAALIFPDDALFSAVAEAAQARGLHIIGNGQRIVVSPSVPPGWSKVAVKIKRPTPAGPEVAPCGA